MLKYNTLQSTIANLRFDDPSFFRAAGLVPLSKLYDAYPASHEGLKLCVLLARGVKPKEIGQLSEGSAARKMIVLQQANKGWSKVWPNAETKVDTSAADRSAAAAAADDLIELVEE